MCPIFVYIRLVLFTHNVALPVTKGLKADCGILFRSHLGILSAVHSSCLQLNSINLRAANFHFITKLVVYAFSLEVLFRYI